VYVAMRDLRVAAPGKNPIRRSRADCRARRTSGRFRSICGGSLHTHSLCSSCGGELPRSVHWPRMSPWGDEAATR
jgi:hypothetical protein